MASSSVHELAEQGNPTKTDDMRRKGVTAFSYSLLDVSIPKNRVNEMEILS
jgi:hypothetical protein